MLLHFPIEILPDFRYQVLVSDLGLRSWSQAWDQVLVSDLGLKMEVSTVEPTTASQC